ncbi:hypothetical protein KSS87_021941 [Heliosperma pusillum]|nr:hypothetical protein KSS87_021941 [Heliosperma pusillum]
MMQRRLIVQKGVTMQHWVMKQERLIVHTRSYNTTMGTEARKTHCSHKELYSKQWVIKQGRLIVHTRSYCDTLKFA